MLSRCLPFLILAFVPALAAQGTPAVFPPPAEVLAGFDLRDGTVQNLALPAAGGAPFVVRIALGGAVRSLALAPHDVRAPDFQLLLDDGVRLRPLPVPPSVTWRGEILELPGSAAAASLVDGQLAATILLADGTMWGVQPLAALHPALPRESHVVYRASDVRLPAVSCGAGGAARPVEGHGGGGAPAAMKVAEIAIDADRAYYTRYGSNTTTVQNQVTSVMNSVGLIYRRDVEIDYQITALVIRTTAIYSWTGDLCNLLAQFGNYWSANHGGVRRDLAHLFTGEGSFSGVIGCAYLGVVCTGSAYGASKAYSSNLTTNTGLVAHETGHNWNAPHCDGSVPCNIMCSGLGGCSGNLTAFAPVSISTIVAFKNSRSCLHDPQPPLLTTLNPTTATSHQPAQITATGQRLDGTGTLTVGGRSVTFTVVNATTLRFTPPTPMTIGPQPVVASNGSGASPPVTLNITGNHPSVVAATQFTLRNFANRFEVHSDASWFAVLLLSTSNVPSSLPGVVGLGIGNAFTTLFEIGSVGCGPDGTGILIVNPPGSAPSGLNLYWQAITLNPANPVLPLEVSNVLQTVLF